MVVFCGCCGFDCFCCCTSGVNMSMVCSLNRNEYLRFEMVAAAWDEVDSICDAENDASVAELLKLCSCAVCEVPSSAVLDVVDSAFELLVTCPSVCNICCVLVKRKVFI